MMSRKIKIKISAIAIVLITFTAVWESGAQNATDLRINEILVFNDSSAVDDFGMRTPWIEIFNSAYNTVNIGGCFLTDDLEFPTKYWIPTGVTTTKIPGRNYIIFWADNHPTRGIFHLNFTLSEGKTIALFDANGKTLIDKIEIPVGQKPDLTYGRKTTDSEEWVYLEKSTPGANNDYSRKKSSGEKFVEYDPYGAGMTVIAMMVVFSALAILFFIYKNLGRFFINRGSSAKKSVTSEVKTAGAKPRIEMSGEVNAAIAMALHLYQSEMHDYENTVLTIQKVSRTYSPWSSKIYTLRKTPNKN
jgi:Na+-transporting methylmalonyl-CoA/oxaloacetate decarboxylase gamma subunit